MTNSFLYQIAKAYTGQRDVPLRRCLFVFPSRRSALFFQKYLGQCSERPLLSPDLITISDLFAKLSPLKRADKIELLYVLWQQYAKVCSRHDRPCEDFDDFVPLAETLAGDFNDIDKYMADHARLLANIRDLRELDSGYEFLSPEQMDALRRFWGVIVSGRDSDQKKKFLSLWAILDDLYVAFNGALKARGIAYEGMLQREVASRLKAGDTAAAAEALGGYDRIVVVGQNALCACEIELYDFIRREFDGDFYWDFYGECLQDPANKASHFIKTYIGRYPSKYEIEAQATSRPEIKVIAASSAVAQAKAAARELARAGEDSCAVVLPDENLLMPLLNSIPENIRHINVTMGYGLHNSSTASLMDMLSALQLGRRSSGFYHKDVLSILNHPFVRGLCADAAAQIKKDIVAGNEIYVPAERFSSDELLGRIFAPQEDVPAVCRWQMDVIGAIAPSLPGIEKEFAHGYYTSVSHLLDLGIDMHLRTYFRFLREVTSSLTVDFRGEPLSGLQVMGPLEVRAIDFDTLIILSVNEGVYPAKTHSDSLIPYNVRRGFGLPTVELFDSIAAYHFYRSIYRARNVVLIYDSRTKGMLSGEESRFVKQLRYHYGYKMTFASLDLEIKPVAETVRAVQKTPQIMERMRELFVGPQAHPLSASKLNDYLGCPLKFYYAHVVGLSEEDEVKEDVDAGQFGNTFHETMQDIYDRIGAGAEITKALLAQCLKDTAFIRERIRVHLNAELRHAEDAPLGRRNQITANLVEELVLATLKNDIAYAPFTYVASEKKFTEDFPVEIAGADETVRLKGYIDRIDHKDGTFRVCDYKTGSAHMGASFLDDRSMDKVFSGDEKIAFQLLVYAWYMHLAKPDQEAFHLAVYDVKKLFTAPVQNNYCPATTIESFTQRLKGLIADIFDDNKPFEGAPAGSKMCQWCPAKAICGR